LQQATRKKPVIVAKGGKGEAGSRAAASHTASLAGSFQTWKAAMTQAGAIPADSIEEMMDYAVSFNSLGAVKGCNVGIAGSGGGPSVLAADQCEAQGLRVVPLPDEIRQELKDKNIPVWDWIGNPVDMTIAMGLFSPGDLLYMMSKSPGFDVLIAIIGEMHYRKRQTGVKAEDYLNRFGMERLRGKPLMVVMPDKSLDLEQYHEPITQLMCDIRTRLIASGIPVYPTMTRAARAARTVADYYQRQKSFPGT
jgi:acyl-CoA synthetase (NDP forming)